MNFNSIGFVKNIFLFFYCKQKIDKDDRRSNAKKPEEFSIWFDSICSSYIFINQKSSLITELKTRIAIVSIFKIILL